MDLEPVSRAYGVDWCGGRVILARWERGRATLLAAGDPDEPDVRRALGEARADVAAGRAAWAAASPPEATFLKELHTPLRSRQKAARVWGGLLDVELPVALDDLSWALACEEPAPDGRRAVVAAIEKREARDFLDRLRAEGIEATHLDAFPAAACALLPPAPRGDTYRVLVWLGDRSVIAVGASAPVPSSFRLTRPGAVPRSFHLLRAEPRNDDAFVSRLVARAGHFLDLARTPDIYWAGPGAADAELLRALEAALRDTGASARFSVLPGGEGTLACKLAERAARAASLQLAPGDVIPPAWTARCQRFGDRWRIAAAAGAVALCAVCGVILHLRAAELDRLWNSVETSASELAAPGHPLMTGHVGFELSREPHKSALDARKLAFERLGPGAQGVAPDLAVLLDAAQNAGVDVARCELSASAFSLLLATDASPDAIDAFADAVLNAGWEVKRFTDDAGRVRLEGARAK